MRKKGVLPQTIVPWNRQITLIVSDVDETIADLYVPAEPEMITELSALMAEGTRLFMVTGSGVESVQQRIVDHIPQPLRRHILIGACNGAEAWGYDEHGNRRDTPFYSLYDSLLTDAQKAEWRELVRRLLDEFGLQAYSPMSVPEFLRKAGSNPRAVMLADRGPQITLEVVNGHALTPEQMSDLGLGKVDAREPHDLRLSLMTRANRLFEDAQVPITARLGGVFAIDFCLRGVSKTTCITRVLHNDQALAALDLQANDLQDPAHIEIWGDKFSVSGGTDRYMSEAFPKAVRSISFRKENPDDFPEGYNIVVWPGQERLHHGLLEYVKQR